MELCEWEPSTNVHENRGRVPEGLDWGKRISIFSLEG